MLDYDHIIGKLIKKRKSENKIIAACVYGSQINGTATKTSDLDVLLVTSGNEDYRGCRMIDGQRIEYFEKSFVTIMNEIEECQKKNNPFYASLFRNCKVIFDTYHFIPYLKFHQAKVSEITAKSSEKATIDYSDLAFYQSQFYNHTNDMDSYFNHYYYVYLDCLRRKYHEENDCSMIPAKKVVGLYQDSSLADYYCVRLPQAEYREFVLHCILDYNCSRQEKEARIEEALQWLQVKRLDSISPKEPKQMHMNRLKNYLISFSNESQKIGVSEGQTLYTMHNLVESLGKLNRLYMEKTQTSLISTTDYEQLILSENSNALKSILNTCCTQFEINPNEYEIAYLSKKYRK